MIVKTVTDDFGKQKIDLNDAFKGLFSRDFFEKKSVLSDSDISALQAYNTELSKVIGYEVENGKVLEITTSTQTAYNRTMLNASEYAQNMAKAAGKEGVALEQIPKVSKAAELGLKALSVAANTLISVGIAVAIAAFTHLYNIQEKIEQKTKELTESLKSQTDEFKSLKNELDGINKKLKDNEDRYTELIRKQKESGLTVEETKELEELQKISGELINQKNILEENIRLKKESAAATANDLADTLLKQQEVLKFMDKTGDKIKNIFNGLQKYILSTIPVVGHLLLIFDAVTEKMKLPKDSWINKLKNVFDGTAIISWLTGTNIEEDTYDETVKKYEDTQKKMKEIRDKYDKDGNGIIDSNASMSKEDIDNYKKYFEESSNYTKKLQEDYEELDNAIKAIEEDENLTQVDAAELKKLRNARDIIAQKLDYTKSNKGGIINDSDVQNAENVTTTLEELNKQLDSIQSAYKTVSSAITEYNETGYLSVDTYQELLALKPEYLAYLMDEEGNLNLTTDALNKLTAARINELAVKQAESLVDTVTGMQSEQEQLKLLKGATDEYTESIWGLINAKITEANLSDEVKENLYTKVNAYKAWAESAIKGIASGGLEKNSSDSNIEKKQKDIEKKKREMADKEKEFAKSMAEAWEDEYLARLEHDLDEHQKILDKYVEQLESIEFDLDILNGLDLQSKTTYYTEQIDVIKQYGKALKDEFTRLSQISYSTGDEAQALADQMSKVGDAMRDNAKSYVEASSALYQNKLDMIVNNAESAYKKLDTMYDRISYEQENFRFDNPYVAELESLTSPFFDNLDSLYAFDNGLFEDNSVDSLVDKKKAESEELIEIERDTQDKINQIVWDAMQLQYEKNAQSRAEERAKLEKDIAEARADFEEEMAELSANTSNIAKITAEKIENSINNMDLKISDVDSQVDENGNRKYTDEQIENMKEIQDLQNQWAEVNEKIYDRYNEAIEKATKAMEMQIDTLEYEYEQENLIIDALEKKYQLQRQLREARREIKAEYEASRDIIAIAGDDGTLFNKDDYDTLNKELKKIDSSLTTLYEDYTKAISALGEDEWYKQQEITNEFERQQEALLDQYEIAKQQLEVSRQRTKMENIANEKNKRMLIGGKWVQTPDLQALYEAKKELSTLEDEEYELRREAAENKELNALRNLNDTTNTEAKAIQNRINMINKMTSEERKALAEELLKVKDMDKIVDNLGKRTLPDFVKVIKDVIDDLSGFTGIEYSAASEANKTNSRGGSSSSSGTSSALEALRNGDKSTAQSILNNSVGKGSSSSSSGNGGNSIINKVSSAVINTASNVVNTITSGLSNIASKISKEPKHHTGRIRGLKPDEERVIVTKDESILTPAQLSPVAQKLMNATDLIEQLRNNTGLLSPTLQSFNIPNVVKNDNSSSQIVEFNGDIIVKEPVQDMNGLLHSVMQEAKLYHLRTKNIR